ncbi:MAG: DNA replication/repair protein RecF [Actinomycetota bacterium]|nr:MAG: DNA replication/repair protein RecF [Actinomycetota bacterium]
MEVRRLSLTDFRSYPQVDLALDSGVTSFVGRNGQGKTNLVEAIAYVATLGSHRVATDAPLVRAGATRAIVRTEVARGDRRTLVELEINPGRANRAQVNRAPVPRPREILGLLRTVVFAPEDLALVRGDPAQRRVFLDDLLVARNPRYAGVRSDLDRVLRQRNALLRSAQAARRAATADVERTLSVWDDQLADLGAELIAARLSLVEALAGPVATAYDRVSTGAGPATLTYVSSLAESAPPSADRQQWRAALLEAVARRRRDELDRGVTLVGPQRDDLALGIGELAAKGYASHGESWSLALALRLASYDVLRGDDDPDAEPVLILDDVFAELDAGRRTALAEVAAGAGQVLVTAAVAADVPEVLTGARYEVAGASVSRA